MVERETNEEMTMTAGTLNRWIALAVGAAFAALLLLWGPATDRADAKAQIFGYSAVPSTTQAGGHPDIVTQFEIGSRFTQGVFPECACNDPKDITLHAPAGVIANPHVVSVCSTAEVATFECSADSQAGFVVLQLFSTFGILPLYRTTPQAGQAGLFVFTPPLGIAVPQYVSVNARTGTDYGLDIKTLGIAHLISFDYYAPVFWGVPGATKNDVLRFAPGEKAVGCSVNPLQNAAKGILAEECSLEAVSGFFADKLPVNSSLPVAPFTQNPTTCVGPLLSTIDTLAYDRETDHSEGPWPGTTGCDQLSFDPSLAAKPTTTSADTASGMALDLKVPQFQDPDTPSPSEIRSVEIRLPDGFTINPNAADGKTSCSNAQAQIGTTEPAECPEFAKVGTTELNSSALPAPIHGYAYLGDPRPGDPYRLILTADGFGTSIKLQGSILANPGNGKLTISFQDLPQAPFQEFNVHMFGSERGVLATPTQCGTYPVETKFTPWAAELSIQESTQFFTIDSGPGGAPCPGSSRPFGPTFEAGSTDNTAGTFSSFAFRATRSDGDQILSAANLTLPPGLLARLRGLPYCPNDSIDQLSSRSGLAEQASPLCPAASRIGGVVTGVGAGSRPLHVPGQIYLAGPYKGAPLSAVVVVPAVSGPYDLGNVVVRAALDVDPRTARVSVLTDPLPRIIQGIPLRLRSADVTLDRNPFTLNPTNCDPFAVETAMFGDQGGVAHPGAPFQVANCAVLGFAPKLSLKLSGGTNRRGHPALTGTLQAQPGDANIGRAVITLPPNELLDNANIGTICTNVRFAAGNCPAASVYGTAEATTPLLDEPLRGTVYLRSSKNDLPDIVADLHGQIDIVLVGRIDTVNGALRTTFDEVPDAPVSRFELRLKGGKKGLLINQNSICGLSQRAKVRMVGQNGRVSNRRVKLQSACGSGERRKRDGHRASRVVR
jgi:hypothetical protein